MKELKPVGWIPSLLIFVIAAGVLRLTHYVFVPAYQRMTGQPYLAGYMIGYVGTMAIFFVISLVVYLMEGHRLDLKSLTSRYRLAWLEKTDWLWLGGMIVGSVVGLVALSFTQPFLRTLPFFAPHPQFPADFIDINQLNPGILFGMSLRGKWWLIPAYFLGWILNIVGEEFFYRGWLLPRQEVAFGKGAWIVNALMFTFQHLFQPWNTIAMIPGSLLVSYAVQRRKKTWLSILWHGILNISLLFFIIQGVIWG